MTADGIGGVWTYAIELARALEAHNVEVHMATMGPMLNRSQCEEARDIANLNLFKSNYKLEWMQDCWRDVERAGDWLLHLENRLQPDLVHLNNYVHAALPWTTAKIVVAHSCVFSWWLSVRGGNATGFERYQHEVTRGLHAADAVAAPSDVMLKALKVHYGPIPNSRVAPNGRNPALFEVGSKRPFIFSAGRLWDEAKNIAILAEIAPVLPWPLCIAGDTANPDNSAHADLVRTNCYLLGPLKSKVMRQWFSSAAICALPAKYEPFGFTALEAALSGCALVLGDIESLREIWGDAAVFVEPDDKAAIRASLLRLIGDEGYRDQMAQRARTRALEFSHTRMAENYLSIYADGLKTASLGKKSEELAACA
jgi:glycosyltransferase involved in cell wall biosynthesis